MRIHNQRGQFSLFWGPLLVGMLALAGMAVLFSMRYERNFFAEAWSRITHTLLGQTLQHTERVIKPGAVKVRKCVIEGRVTYSNVECDAGNLTSRPVDLQDTSGIVPPKAPPVDISRTEEPRTYKEKMIDKALERASSR